MEIAKERSEQEEKNQYGLDETRGLGKTEKEGRRGSDPGETEGEREERKLRKERARKSGDYSSIGRVFVCGTKG